jgi:hypothetical protein
MTTEFAIEWEGFTGGERERLKTQWSRIQFSPKFTAKFQGSISKGSPGAAGFFHFEAKDLRFFREHFSGEVAFTDLNELVESTAELATTFYAGLLTQGVLPAE